MLGCFAQINSLLLRVGERGGLRLKDGTPLLLARAYLIGVLWWGAEEALLCHVFFCDGVWRCVHACDRRTPVRRVWICGQSFFFLPFPALAKPFHTFRGSDESRLNTNLIRLSSVTSKYSVFALL